MLQFTRNTSSGGMKKIDKYIYTYNISKNFYLHFKERLYFIQASMINNQHAQLLLNFI